MTSRIRYFSTTALLVLLGGLWIGVVIALIWNGGHVDGPAALRCSLVTVLVLAALSIKFPEIVRKICFPFAFLS